MARTSFTNPSRARRQIESRSNAEVVQVTVIVEIHTETRTDEIISCSSNGTSNDENRSSSSKGTSNDENKSSSSKGTSNDENKSSSSKGTSNDENKGSSSKGTSNDESRSRSNDAEEMVQVEKLGKSKGKRPMISETESKRMRQSVKGNITGKGNKSEIDTTVRPKRGRGRPRGSKTVARAVRSSYSQRSVKKPNAGQRGKGRKQEETDVSEGSEPDLEEVCKGFKGRNNDDDSDDNDGTGGGGEARQSHLSWAARVV